MPQTAADLRKMYSDATGRPWTDEEGRRWLMQRYENLDIHEKIPRLHSTAYVSLSDKVSGLAQRFCPYCDLEGAKYIIPIRLQPESYQSLDSIDKTAFKAAMAERFKGYPLPLLGEVAVCMHLTFVCGGERRIRDLDNMAKLLLDATKGLLYGDDRKIDHLDIMRVSHAESEEYLYLAISASSLNDHANTAAPILQHSWAGAPELNLEDFRPKPATTIVAPASGANATPLPTTKAAQSPS